ncbi:hypothetical protein N7491_006503 [Penicillium cf. griseofulvum]|nr:hypothetical protein N7491_006503 [Penicillium cf. griseofulvum]
MPVDPPKETPNYFSGDEEGEDEIEAREAEEERIERGQLRIGTGRILFAPGISAEEIPRTYEFIRRHKEDNNRTQSLIYMDRACVSNGQARPRAGWSFVFRPCTPGIKGQISFPLELEGPTGREYAQTSNRTKLCAILAALRFRWW